MRTNKSVAETFVRGGESCKSENMIYVEGDYGEATIYSYGTHYPIARKVGFGEYLVNSSGYSVTTSMHKSLVLRAIPSMATIWYAQGCDLNFLPTAIEGQVECLHKRILKANRVNAPKIVVEIAALHAYWKKAKARFNLSSPALDDLFLYKTKEQVLSKVIAAKLAA